MNNKCESRKTSYKNNFKQKGITLIAVIITVIILLILAAIIMGTLWGDNGLINRAQAGKNTHEVGMKNEGTDLQSIGGVLNDIDTGANANRNRPQNENQNENETYTDKNGKTATVPKDFTVSNVEGEKTIDEGLVIKDSLGNEFVWIPVPDVNEMYEVIGGKKVGKLYDFGTYDTPKNPAVQMTYSTTGYREPDVLTNTTYGDTDARIADMGLVNINTQVQFKAHLQAEFDKMIESVEEYHRILHRKI